MSCGTACPWLVSGDSLLAFFLTQINYPGQPVGHYNEGQGIIATLALNAGFAVFICASAGDDTSNLQ